jgi:hypothetical protein
VFYATTDLETARVFAAANPAAGQPAVVGIRLRSSLAASVERGIVSEVERFPGTHAVEDWEAFNELADFEVVE